MKRYREIVQPCVIWPEREHRDEQHVIHGTEGRAQRNAALTATYGARFHWHTTTKRTLWGLLMRAERAQ